MTTKKKRKKKSQPQCIELPCNCECGNHRTCSEGLNPQPDFQSAENELLVLVFGVPWTFGQRSFCQGGFLWSLWQDLELSTDFIRWLQDCVSLTKDWD